MSRAVITVTVYDCPREQARTVLTVIGQRLAGGPYYGEPVAARNGVLILGSPYYDNDAPATEGAQIAAELASEAPGATFSVIEEANRERPGTASYHTPELGLRVLDADHDGAAQFTGAHILGWFDDLDQGTTGPWSDLIALGTVRQMVRERTGETHRDAMRVPERQLGQHLLRIVAGATVGLDAQAARRYRAAVFVEGLPGCATCDEDRQVRLDGTRWVHVDTGGRACDDAVILNLPGDLLDGLPAMLREPSPTVELDAWTLELPNGRRLSVTARSFTFVHAAAPVV